MLLKAARSRRSILYEGTKPLSIRHYFATLVFSSELIATYSFRPDSITKKHWGIVEFNMTNFEHSIMELAPDPEEWGWPQETVCVCLGNKLEQSVGLFGVSAPATLEWAS